MDEAAIRNLCERQDGVVSRTQLLAGGAGDHDLARWVRRRRLVRVHLGVYVDHTGPLSWRQRAWAAVLCHWPAALCGESALLAVGARGPWRLRSVDAPIEVAVDGSRHPGGVAGITLRRVASFDDVALMNVGPPRVRVEHAVLDVAASARDEARMVGALSDACQAGLTTAGRLGIALKERPRLARRRLMFVILADVAAGAYSVLEQRYLVRVERPHGLPNGRRQRRVRAGRAVGYRDVEYLAAAAAAAAAAAVVVELDGRLGHEWSADRWADLDRDVAAVVGGALTLRCGWQQVLEPCRLAAVVGRLLLARGWRGRLVGCGPGCPVGDIVGDSRAPGA